MRYSPIVSTDPLSVMTAAECFMLLHDNQRGIGRIAIANPRPTILPVNYLLDGEDIIFRTAAGTKLSAAVDGRRVAFEVDAFGHPLDDTADAWSVLVRGMATRVSDPDEITRLGLARLTPAAGGVRPHYVRIVTEQISGRRLRMA